jgi:hypothetical protein
MYASHMRILPRSCEAGQWHSPNPGGGIFNALTTSNEIPTLLSENTSTQARSGVAPRAVQGANQSTARPFLSTDGEILAPFGASCDRADSAIFLAVSTSEQVTIICELPYLKQAAGRPVLFGSRDDAAFLLKCFRCGTFNRFTYRSHTSRSMSLPCERSVWRFFSFSAARLRLAWAHRSFPDYGGFPCRRF